MKKTINRLAFLIVILSILFSCTGCDVPSLLHIIFTGSDIEVPPTASPNPIHYEASTDKLEYAYGEEITVELLFITDPCTKEASDGNTYCVKILESPYYEIIGDSEVYTDGSENAEVIEGNFSYGLYWYRVIFKIRINEYSDRERDVDLAIRCVTDNWLLDFLTEKPYHYSGDPEYPFIAKVRFCPNSKTVIFYEHNFL